MNVSPGTRIGAYEVRPLLGRGGTAYVYRAFDTRLRRDVALKIVTVDPHADSRVRLRLEREARILAGLEHPNIARIHGLEHIDGVYALVLELIEGPTLADRIAAGPVPVDEALAIARQIAAALEAAHDRGVIHRDLKPSNVKLSDGETVKVLDFGLARVLRPASEEDKAVQPTVTADGIAVGTAAYMSPEQARGRPVDERADIWAFGCVLYELLTGRRAFQGDDTASTFAAILRAEPEWDAVPSDCPATVRIFMRRCLSKEPADRIRHIGDVRLALDGRLDADTATLKPAESLQGRGWRRGWTRALTIALTACVAMGAGAWLGSGTPTPATPRTYLIHAPSGASFGDVTMEPFPSVSPDGASVAYRTSADVAGPLWIHRLGEIAGRPLPGSERLGIPFWSPDGRFVGVGGQAGLHIVAASGGSVPQRVCACPIVGRAAWAADGTILFSQPSGLFQVPATGGAIKRVTTTADDLGEFEHQHPLFLADGRRFLFLVKSTRRERAGVYLASLDDPASARRLLEDSTSVDLGKGPDGGDHLFFVRDNTLLAQPFDVARGELTDSPMVIAPRVVPGEGGRLAPFAAGGRSLVFRQSTPPQSRLRWFDRRGLAERGGLDLSGSFRYLQLSADGRWLTMARFDAETARPDVWMHDLHRGVGERVTTDPIGAFFPVWTPAADRIIYASAREGPWHLFWRSSTGPDGGRTYAALQPATKYPSDVSKDGRWLVFSGDSAVWMLPLAQAGDPIRLVAGLQGRVSPDGRWLAYTSLENGRREVYVTTFPTPTVRVRISIDGGEDPRWRGDGRELFYLDGELTLVAAAVRTAPDFEVIGQQPLFRTAIDNRSLRFGASYVPDETGRRFLINERIRGEEIVLTVMENWMPGGR